MGTLLIAMLAASAVSAVSFTGIATLSLRGDRQKKVINLLLSLAAGAMLGNAFLHLLPHSLESTKHEQPAIVQIVQSTGHDHASLYVFALVLAGFLTLYCLDLALLTRGHKNSECVRPLGYLVLLSDGLENFLDGIVIGAAFLVSIPAGISTTIAIFLHEVPMELGDYAVLRHSGFSRRNALLLNFASAMVNLLGVTLAFTLGSTLPGFTAIATPFSAGAILYLAATGILPQIRMQGTGWQKASYLSMTLLGVAIMALILLLE